MKKRQIISILNDLNIDKDKYIITGETALTIYGIIKECDYIFLMCSESIDNEFIKVINKTCNFELVHNFKVESLESLFAKEENKTLKRKIEDLILIKDNHHFENELYNKGYKLIAGTDEAGRGPLCGPVVAAAVILPHNYELSGLTDSKNLQKSKEKNILKL